MIFHSVLLSESQSVGSAVKREKWVVVTQFAVIMRVEGDMTRHVLAASWSAPPCQLWPGVRGRIANL